ncbi:MAG TPA: serine/threonine-protein kinase [Gemmatimonadaceae bacterium]|nr:serine/threonine-protein kinase [Gemmatimonadaceae bacterium]
MPERHLGQTLGRFRVDSLIGAGGFAWVYKGYDPELDIPVAVKVLKPQYAGDENVEERFRREASTAAKLRHPNIVRILAVGRQDSAVYFVMDLLPTGLDTRLQLLGTLPEPMLIRLGLDVTAALAFAHREGVIHRDIKTDNILFDEHGNAVVADFGIARAMSDSSEHTRTNMVVGTPQYFSPEQARGQSLDGRSDLYSLGVTLFKAATGVVPFQGDDWYEIARAHVEDRPPRPGSFNPALSRDMERVILQCLEKDPEDRYPSAEALHAELTQRLIVTTPQEQERTLSLTATQRLPFSASAAAARWRRTLRRAFGRTPGRWALPGAIALLAIAIVIVTALRSRGRGAPAPTRTAAASSLATRLPPSAVPLDTRPDTVAAVAPTPDTTAGALGTAPQATHQPPPPRILHVTAPAGAVITVDGVPIGTGSLSSDSLAAGRHEIAATMESFIAPCSTARASTHVRLGAHGTTRVSLTPRACGSMALDVVPAGAHFAVTTAAGDSVENGVAPLDTVLVLPAGSYHLQVSARYCAPYTSHFELAAGEEHHEWAHLICVPPSS